MSTETAKKPSVLFVCVHNAGRSQMAAAFLTTLGEGRIEVRSAGSQPADKVNPAAVEAMAELGIDMSAEIPKILTTEAVQGIRRRDHHGLRRRPARTSPASATRTGSSRTRPARASTPSARSATRSRPASRA